MKANSIPVKRYLAKVAKAEVDISRPDTSIVITFEIVDACPLDGELFKFEPLLVFSENKILRNMSRRLLADIAKAAGRFGCADVDDLVGGRLFVWISNEMIVGVGQEFL